MTRFYEIRANALAYWIKQTKRVITDDISSIPNDDLSETFECSWQRKSDCGHVSIFCSLGDWASNITDILRDESLDKCHVENKEESKQLFRYYTRLLLVISELLTDFQDLYIEAAGLPARDKKSNTAARNFLFSLPEIKEYPVQEIFDFINTICKHKNKNLHRCNHHLDLFFDDSKEEKPSKTQLVHIKNLSFDGQKDGILVPKLQYFLTVLLQCYKNIDHYFEHENKQGFEKVCKAYSN
ncbi:hypothetical protein GCM10027037_00330 [Mucilaginibacter koreensis]